MWISLIWSSEAYNSPCPTMRGMVLPAPKSVYSSPLALQDETCRQLHFLSFLLSFPMFPTETCETLFLPIPIHQSLKFGWNNLVFLRTLLGFRGGSVVETLPANVGATGDMSSNPGSGQSPGEGNGNPLQDFCLGNPMDKGAWQATVHGVAKSWAWLSN